MTARSTSRFWWTASLAHGELSSEERASFIESLQDEVGGKVLETNVEQNVLLQGEFHGSFLGTNLYTGASATT